MSHYLINIFILVSFPTYNLSHSLLIQIAINSIPYSPIVSLPCDSSRVIVNINLKSYCHFPSQPVSLPICNSSRCYHLKSQGIPSIAIKAANLQFISSLPSHLTSKIVICYQQSGQIAIHLFANQSLLM